MAGEVWIVQVQERLTRLDAQLIANVWSPMNFNSNRIGDALLDKLGVPVEV